MTLSNSNSAPTLDNRIPSFNKTGVCVSKCYQMLCGRCGCRFARTIVFEMTNDPTEQNSVFGVQEYFSSTMNHEHECPFCFQRVQIILSTQMLVGTYNQLDYNKTIDKISQ